MKKIFALGGKTAFYKPSAVVGCKAIRNFSSGSVYSWGNGDEGQLARANVEKSGFSNHFIETIPAPVTTFPTSSSTKTFVDVSAGTSHGAAVNSAGELFTWGDSKYGKLGHSVVTTNASGASLCLVPAKVDLPGKVSKVSCGESHTAALTTDGDVYTWGWGGSTWSGTGCLGHGNTESLSVPKKVEFPDPNIKISSISSGKLHMAAVGVGGEVWTWGRGEYGRNGNGGNADQLSPSPLEFFLDCDVEVSQLSCGSNFTLAVGTNGLVYGWGSNDNSQLGLGGGFAVDMFSMESFPKMIDALVDVEVVKVAAGERHAIAVAKNGEVFTWGMKLWMEPLKMSVLESEMIVDANCGGNFSMVVNDVGKVFSWGKGMGARNSGSLGHGHTKRVVQPQLIDSLSEPIKKISCGNKFVLAISGIK